MTVDKAALSPFYFCSCRFHSSGTCCVKVFHLFFDTTRLWSQKIAVEFGGVTAVSKLSSWWGQILFSLRKFHTVLEFVCFFPEFYGDKKQRILFSLCLRNRSMG